MLKLDLPFHLAERPDGTFLSRGLLDLDRSRTNEVTLAGLRVTVETREKIYSFSSDGPPQADHPGRSRGAIWQRTCWPLTDGVSFEQQLLLPAEGSALAVSWRLIGAALFPVRTTVRPVFSADQPFSPTGFDIEPECRGGRLAWRPHRHVPQIIADTNGCISTRTIPDPSGGVPACFEFNLGPRPAILILSSESHSAVETDPLMGAFLAQLSEQGATKMDCDHQRNLAAA